MSIETNKKRVSFSCNPYKGFVIEMSGSLDNLNKKAGEIGFDKSN